MDTERLSPRYAGIDAWSASDALDAMIDGQFSAIAAVRNARTSIEAAALAMEARLSSGGRIIYAGAGTSGRLAVQDGAELMPTFNWPPARLVLLIAGGEAALAHAVEGAEDQTDLAVAAVQEHEVHADDVLIAVAASGTTPFTVTCLREAARRGALTVGIANNPRTPILDEAEYAIFLDSGAEPIAGSTRMNAGTAQRVALNLLSSLVMIQLGRVYKGLMVEMQPTNKKLLRRCETMLQHLIGCSPEDARAALARADGSFKVALLLLSGCSLQEAQEALAKSGGKLRPALELARCRTKGDASRATRRSKSNH